MTIHSSILAWMENSTDREACGLKFMGSQRVRLSTDTQIPLVCCISALIALIAFTCQYHSLEFKLCDGRPNLLYLLLYPPQPPVPVKC